MTSSTRRVYLLCCTTFSMRVCQWPLSVTWLPCCPWADDPRKNPAKCGTAGCSKQGGAGAEASEGAHAGV